MNTWAEIWSRRRLDPSRGSLLAQLMAADGLDTGFGHLTEESWRAFVTRAAARLDVNAGAMVYDVGCGAGAFLLPLHERGARVGGIDQSAALVEYAREAIPSGAFTVGEARSVDAAEQWDAVVACGVFMYFPSLDYAAEVLEKMARKAVRSIAVLDVPDAALRAEAMQLRRGTLGEREYEERYRGLDHFFYEPGWMVKRLQAAGWTNAVSEPQDIRGYANGAHRFNVFATR